MTHAASAIIDGLMIVGVGNMLFVIVKIEKQGLPPPRAALSRDRLGVNLRS